MGGGGVMRAVGKVAGVGIVNSGLRGGVQGTPLSAEQSVMRVAASSRSASSVVSVSSEGVSSVVDTTASVSHKSSWEMVDDWEFAGDFEQEAALEGSIAASGRPEPIARVLFSGVPSLEEAKEATNDLKDALDKVYLSSPKYSETVQVTGVSSLSNTEETKDCVAYNIEATSVPKPAIQAFKLLNESPAVQSVVASIASDPNVWNAVLNNSAYMDFIKSQQTNDKFEFPGSPRSSVSSVKLEENEDSGDSFSAFIQKIKTSVVEMVSKTTDFLHSLFSLPSADKAKENAGSNNMDKTIGASLMGLAVMVIMVVLLKRV
ncbi:hypothetical protein E1A91_A11G308600v1 [Gossypium mustelinum]|uniref:Uncharacterized protein n=2 Tax=Gossypium TaxID=3633 RepID=A0A5J5TVQ4_GOSBA|nr:hypothetical protein ES319_A11G308000v1 [Gossypium barbadense]KAB2059493.1 hypothetical protein ES319_A11G308000v1 [Gossypium barbadense]TYJ11884.1 hypothetical protein E1A91_A11G308600v1 [Gossypium mustelinum]